MTLGRIATLALFVLVAVALVDPVRVERAFRAARDAVSAMFTAAGVPQQQSESGERPETVSFLVASEELVDPNFQQTVVLVLERGSLGAIGIVINRQTDASLSDLIKGLVEPERRAAKLYAGGPVALDQVLMLLRSDEPLDDAQRVFDDVYVTGDLGLIRTTIRERKDVNSFRVYAGYAGWTAGQLEAETRRGDWQTAPADASAIFSASPAHVWERLNRASDGEWARNTAAVAAGTWA